MEKMLLDTRRIFINSKRSLVLKNYLENKCIWTHVYTRENDVDTYIGFYGNYRGMKEYIRYNKDYVVFCFINPYSNHSEFIKKIYDMNSKECLGYNEYNEFEKIQGKTLRKVR